MRSCSLTLSSCHLVALSLLFLTACVPMRVAQPLPTRVPIAQLIAPAHTSVFVSLQDLPPTFTAIPTWQAIPTSTATPVPTLTVTPDPYAPYTIEYLAQRPYGTGGDLQVGGVLAETAAFTRYLITYPSDGLTIYGFINVPQTPGPHPVVLVLHGYWPTDEYDTIGYTTPYADALAQAGFIAIHPNYRNHPPSDEAAGKGANEFRIGYAIDVLNLLAHVQRQAGQVGVLQTADPHHIHLFGHSMGGGIALRVLAVSEGVETAVLYGAMSGDEAQNFAKIREWSNNSDGRFERNIPDEALYRISPIYHLQRITARVSIHHGTADATVPPEWSADLCQRLRDLGKGVECFDYAGQPHNFTASGNRQLLERAIALFGDESN